MNYINDYALKYHEQLIKLSNDVSEICEDSRYVLGKHANIRADILMVVIEQEENGFLDNINWFNFARGNDKSKTAYDFFKTMDETKYDINIPEWEDKNVCIKPKGKTSTIVFYDEYRELDEESERIVDEYLNQK